MKYNNNNMYSNLPLLIQYFHSKYILYHQLIKHNKNIFKNERVRRDIKTEKAQKQDWNGTFATKLN